MQKKNAKQIIGYRIYSVKHPNEGPIAGSNYNKDIMKTGVLGKILQRNIQDIFESKKKATELDTDSRVVAMGKANFKTASYFTKKHFESINPKRIQALIQTSQAIGAPLAVKKEVINPKHIIDQDKEQITVKRVKK